MICGICGFEPGKSRRRRVCRGSAVTLHSEFRHSGPAFAISDPESSAVQLLMSISATDPARLRSKRKSALARDEIYCLKLSFRSSGHLAITRHRLRRRYEESKRETRGGGLLRRLFASFRRNCAIGARHQPSLVLYEKNSCASGLISPDSTQH